MFWGSGRCREGALNEQERVPTFFTNAHVLHSRGTIPFITSTRLPAKRVEIEAKRVCD